MHAVSILTRTNIGLSTDARLIAGLLESRRISSRTYMARVRNRYALPARIGLRAGRLVRAGLPHANIFIQDARAGWFDLARRNILIPNQEYCEPPTRRLLGQVDMVMCKTRLAEAIFRDLDCNARFTGFTSDDRFDPSVVKTRNRVLHVAGWTKQKGTQPLLDLWLKHPEWPELVVVARYPWLDPALFAAPNITLVREVQSTAQLAVLQNSCAVHICPSEAEGFGHAICEGLACGAVVITTDGPPMNELVQPDHGVVVPYRSARPKNLGTAYFIDPEALELAVERVLAMGNAELAAMGQRARRFFLASDAAFREAFAAAWDSLL